MPPLSHSPLSVHGRVLEAEVRRQVHNLEVAGQLLDDLLQGGTNPFYFLKLDNGEIGPQWRRQPIDKVVANLDDLLQGANSSTLS